MDKKAINILELAADLRCLRKLFECSWSKETAHYSINFVSEPMPKSTGQCFVTSWICKDFLQRKYNLQSILVCRGTLLYKDIEIIKDHCWLECFLSSKKIIIDLTQDQSTANPLFIKSEKECQEAQFFYKRNMVYESERKVKIEAMDRVYMLKERMWKNSSV